MRQARRSTSWANSPREELERLVEGQEGRIRAVCDNALRAAGIGIDAVDRLLMIGGSSRVPLFRRWLKRWYGEGSTRTAHPEPVVHEPDLSVGAGAALKAASLGLIYRAERGASVWMKGFATASRSPVAVVVQCQSGTADERPVRAALSWLDRPGDAVAGQVVTTGEVLFQEVPLRSDGWTDLRLWVEDHQGEPIADLAFPLRLDPEFIEPLGLNTSANLLASDLSLEVYKSDGSGVTRERLARRFTPLPATFEHTFRFPPSATGLLLFPLFADRRPIQQIHVRVDPNTRLLSDIQITVSIDAAHRMSVRGRCLEAENLSEFEFAVVADEPTRLKSETDFEGLCQTIDRLLTLPVADRDERRERYQQLRSEIESAFKHGELVRAIARLGELSEFQTALSEAVDLIQPPWESFLQLLEMAGFALKELGDGPGQEHEVSSADLEAVRDQAATALDRSPPDFLTYKNCYFELEGQFDRLRTAFLRQRPKQFAEIQLEAVLENYKQTAPLALNEIDKRRVNEAHQAIHDAELLLRAGNLEHFDANLKEAAAKLDQVGRERNAKPSLSEYTGRSLLWQTPR